MKPSPIIKYGKHFEQLVRGLCSKYSELIFDPIWAYEDLWQEAEIIVFETEIKEKARLSKMARIGQEKYLYISIKYHFIDIQERTNNRKKAEEGFSSEHGV